MESELKREAAPSFTMRELSVEDAAAYFDLIQNNREYFSNFDNMSPDKYPTVESVVGALAQSKKKRWGIFEGDALIGSVSIKPTDSPDVGEIGYLIAKDYSGRGYATEAVKNVLGLIPDSYSAVIAVTNPSNVGSERVLQKAGFVLSQTNDQGHSVYRLDRPRR